MSLPVRQFRQIASGEDRSILAMLARPLLAGVSVGYGAVMRARNWAYDRGHFTSTAVDLPVISVGNVTLGGTGKTPLVAWLARWFRQKRVRVAIASRGYGAERGGANDEALELELQLPDVPHLLNPDRVAAALLAREELASQLLLLDDAFQHRRIRRDLDIVVLDALNPFGYGWVFPRGMLREPLAGLRRADVVVLSRADLVTNEARNAIRRRVERFASATVWIEASHRPRVFVAAGGAEFALDSFRGRPVFAFCGLGNPAGFRRTLEGLGCEVVGWREFPDHHAYSRDDVASLAEQITQLPAAEAVVCTMKDLVKLDTDEIGPLPLRAVAVDWAPLADIGEFEQRLEPLAERALLAQPGF